MSPFIAPFLQVSNSPHGLYQNNRCGRSSPILKAIGPNSCSYLFQVPIYVVFLKGTKLQINSRFINTFHLLVIFTLSIILSLYHSPFWREQTTIIHYKISKPQIMAGSGLQVFDLLLSSSGGISSMNSRPKKEKARPYRPSAQVISHNGFLFNKWG